MVGSKSLSVFEIKEKDLLGRIGKLKTKTATVETPLLFPVINPVSQPISCKRLKETFGCQALITNSYINKKRFGEKIIQDGGLHKFLNYDGALMTDSGAFQLSVYGDIEVQPLQILDFQYAIKSDMIQDIFICLVTSRVHHVHVTMTRIMILFNLIYLGLVFSF